MPRALLSLGMPGARYAADGKVHTDCGAAHAEVGERAVLHASAAEAGAPCQEGQVTSLRISVALNIVLTRGPLRAPTHRKSSRRERQRMVQSYRGQPIESQPLPRDGTLATHSEVERAYRCPWVQQPCQRLGPAVRSCTRWVLASCLPTALAPSRELAAVGNADQEADPLISRKSR